MKSLLIPFLLCFFSSAIFSQHEVNMNHKKAAAIKSIESQSDNLIKLSKQIWEYAETALREKKSSAVLADYAESQGFTVERGVAGMPTAFTATYGNGKPVIGILGEFDALPGLSQKAVPNKSALKEGAGGHGCGHNLFGPASLGAAIAIKELIQKGDITGTIKFYGTPAEESVGGKIYMARAGMFAELDLCMDWHPAHETRSGVQSSLAIIDFYVEFFGKAAHASSDPWNGRSAVDGMELFNMGVNTFREHVLPSVRIHYAIMNGGDVPNVVPEYAKVWMWIRDSKRSVVQEVYDRVQQIAEGAALMADVKAKVSLNVGDHELLVNRTGGKVVHDNMKLLDPITYTEAEQDFAKAIQRATGKDEVGMIAHVKDFEETREHPGGGSTDVGDVSWVTPVVRLRVATAPADVPWHSWAVVACGGMSIGQKGMLFASKSLAISMIDFFENEGLRNDIRNEFIDRKGDYVFKAMLRDGPPPIPQED